MRLIASLLFAALLAGCSTGLQINHDHPSVNYDSRAQYIILHYTSAPQARSLALLTHGEVSAHYLIGDDAPATVFQLVDENQRAWHAGESEWQGRTWLNSDSIGIEIVNPGYLDTPTGRVWYPYSEAQIEHVIALVRDIAARHRIPARNIIGHSDIAPLRKQDPGPLFPWKRLADAGLGIWPSPAAVAQQKARFDVNLPNIAWFQHQLARVGYAVPQSGVLDITTIHVLAAFQMHFRPQRYDGQPDAQSAAILQVLANMP
ncbi:N-acetylmuramoyl-L-alanine amidase [Pseudomonas sp. dw_358]|uniref:N-acetylmuramoyl-L-alanine amidase n=1 Tax=Pseudomonas sp. dw_358 TaxID=2720083 RepID=UPI001BD1C8C0|nr:N-acetylmuramoyl-L-alanine amidase [Pseudomonas sp. dw_358]